MTQADLDKFYKNKLGDQWQRVSSDNLILAYHDELRFNMIIEKLNIQPGGLILDVGCGTGVLLDKIYKRQGLGVGLDISMPSIKRAKESLEQRGSKPLLVVSDGTRLPFKSSSFDKVIITEVIEHLSDIASIKSALSEVKRVGKSDAVFIFTVPNLFYLWRYLPLLGSMNIIGFIKGLKYGLANEDGDEPIHWVFTPSTLFKIIAESFDITYKSSTLKWYFRGLTFYRGPNKVLKAIAAPLGIVFPQKLELKIAKMRLFSSENRLNKYLGIQLIVVARQKLPLE